jgi:hypothetical protein
MTKEEFKALKLKAKADIDFTDENYHMKTMELPGILQYFTEKSLFEKSILIGIEDKRKEKFKKLYNHYKFDDTVDWKNREEVNIQVGGDPDYRKIIREEESQTLIIEFVDKCINNIKTMGYMLRQYHDIKLLKNGFVR